MKKGELLSALLAAHQQLNKAEQEIAVKLDAEREVAITAGVSAGVSAGLLSASSSSAEIDGISSSIILGAPIVKTTAR